MFVGRESECAKLRATLHDALNGRTRIVALRGDPGIGKSELLAWAVTQAEGFQILRLQGYEIEREIPFSALWPLIRVLDSVRADLPEEQIAALEGALDIGAAHHGDQAGVAAAVLAMLAAAAERQPLLIAVDDAHLIDLGSIQVVGFALRRLHAEQVAAVLTARMGTEVPEYTERLLAATEQIVLDGLDLESARALTAEQGLLPEAVWRAAGGNPLAMIEGAAASGPVTFLGEPMHLSLRLLRGYGQRLVGLPERARNAMLLLAVAGGATDVLDAALGEFGLARADLEPAEQANLVVLGPGTTRFAHPLVHSAVYQSASPATRRAAHRALVTAYDGRTGPGATDRRAFHLAAATAGPSEAVAAELDAAAQTAVGRQNFVVATALYEHAAFLTPPGRSRAERILASAVAGQAAGKLDAVGRLLDIAVNETDDDDLRIAAMHFQCRVHMWSGNAGQARDQLLDLADRTAAVSADWSAEMRAQAAVVSIAIGESRAALPMARKAVEGTAGRPDQERLAVLLTQSVTLAINGDATDARALLDRCLPHLSLLDPLSIDQPLLLAALTQASLGEITVAVESLERLVRRARAAHAVGLLPFQLSWLTVLCWFAGRPVDALAYGGAAVESAQESGWTTELPNCLVALATVESCLGRVDDAAGHLARATGLAAGSAGQRLVDAQAARVRGLTALAAGRPAEAAEALRTAAEFAAAAQLGDPVLFGWVANLTEALIRCEDREQALRAFRKVEREVERTGRASAVAVAARCSGLLAGTLEAARPHFEAALAHHTKAGDTFERARTELCYGEVLNRAKQRREAREHLQAAAAGFGRLGAVVWEQRAEDALRATGMKLRPRNRRPAERLTAKEVQVAAAAADGLSNVEVARLLVVTPRTVEFHLSNVYRKLDIQGVGARAELARIRRESPELLTGTDG